MELCGNCFPQSRPGILWCYIVWWSGLSSELVTVRLVVQAPRGDITIVALNKALNPRLLREDCTSALDKSSCRITTTDCYCRFVRTGPLLRTTFTAPPPSPSLLVLYYKQAAFHKMLINGLELHGLLVDYCDVFISCLGSHSDGTHSLQRIYWWASDVMIHFSKSDEEIGWGWGHYQQILKFWWTIPLMCTHVLTQKQTIYNKQKK